LSEGDLFEALSALPRPLQLGFLRVVTTEPVGGSKKYSPATRVTDFFSPNAAFRRLADVDSVSSDELTIFGSLDGRESGGMTNDRWNHDQVVCNLDQS
jgi:hypothetical protein